MVDGHSSILCCYNNVLIRTRACCPNGTTSWRRRWCLPINDHRGWLETSPFTRSYDRRDWPEKASTQSLSTTHSTSSRRCLKRMRRRRHQKRSVLKNILVSRLWILINKSSLFGSNGKGNDGNDHWSLIRFVSWLKKWNRACTKNFASSKLQPAHLPLQRWESIMINHITVTWSSSRVKGLHYDW